MTNGLEGLTSLSRSSDHLGNLANVLKDLGGGGTLLHELTQNANDARASQVRFTATDRELAVWNSAVFTDCGRQELRQCPWKVRDGRRSCDLHSFRQVAGRHKAGDDATTGAFGVGFTAVYQVTDHPELVTGGSHLVLDESRAEDDRIEICYRACGRDHATAGTTFYLPWARQQTALRTELGASALGDDEISKLTDEMVAAAGPALVFLEHVERLDVVVAGVPTIVTRATDGNRVVLSTDGSRSEWLLLADNAAGSDELKERFDQGRSRSDLVQVAVPMDGEVIGRIYADLPTETPSGWSGHINGTFFPRQDRKGIEFDGAGFRGRWNDLLIATAARITAEQLETIASALGHRVAWAYVVDAELVNRAIQKTGQFPEAFNAFFEQAKASVPRAKIALLADGTSVVPGGTVVPLKEVEYDAADALTKLGLWVIDRGLRPLIQRITYTEYGIRLLSAAHVVDALQDADLVEAWTPTDTTDFTANDVEVVLRLLDNLQDRGKSILVDAGAGEVAIVPCIDGSFAVADSVSRLHGDDRALFELLDPELKILDEPRLAALCPALVELCDDITPSRAIEIFEADSEALSVGPDLVLEWLANHRAALVSEDLRARVCALSIFPSASGELRPLNDLSLPSDFDDVLGVADLVDQDRIAGHTDLLRLLGAKELDASEYMTRHVAPFAADGDLTTALAAGVLEIVHRHRPELEAQGARDLLRRTPLVPCTDGVMRVGPDVHLPNRALSLIAPDTPIADTALLGDHLRSALTWLGVADQPSHAVLNEAARRLGEEAAQPNVDVALAVLNALPNPPESENPPTTLNQLRASAWLPCEGGVRGRPDEVFAIFQRYLFESQGKKLAVAREDQQRLTKVLDWLGVQSTPTTAMVVAHLRHCAELGLTMNPEVYRALGQAKEEYLVAALRNVPCIQVAQGEFVEPTKVFWSDPGFGSWAQVLSPTSREYQAFYDRVRVNEAPSPDQIEQTLRGISRGASNDRLGDEVKRVVHRCWELLDEVVGSAGAELARLGAIKCAVGPRDILEMPTMLLFADGRRLAEGIRLIRDNLVRRDKTTHRALAAAGVRAAEEVITSHVDSALSYGEAVDLPSRIRDRVSALERLVEAQRTDGSDIDLDRLAGLRIDLMPELAVEYVTRFAHQHHVDPPRPTEAIYFAEDHRLIVREDKPSRHVAREIALCIAPDLDASSLAPSITEVLAAPSLADAMSALDDYGVRDLDATTWQPVESQSAVEMDVDDSERWTDESEANPADTQTRESDAEFDEIPDPADESDRTLEHDTASGKPDGTKSKARTRSGTGQRRAHMASFVSFDEDERELNQAGDEAPERSAVDEAGVARVLIYELSCGRVPEEQAHNNPGFDVLSRDDEGEVVRRIEVKSIGGAWTGFGVWMSATQLEDNRVSGDDYWLYVVEHAEDDDAAVIHRIQNPAANATKFGFDPGWQALREPDLERDASGKPLTSNTRRLLGWSGPGNTPAD
ncbi:protein NO VEIN domain-containing protein [Nocardioides sp. LHG3406-4]|uniref:protein NO VEIN domain-containing protein n=1 Tax=Nocardioides sp. LHG3406-4 TaxID=2804575 RepID=UPI003CE953D1